MVTAEYSRELTEVLHVAAAAGTEAGEEMTPSFTGLVVGLMTVDGWFQKLCESLGIERPQIRGTRGNRPKAGPTQSVQRMLGTAERYQMTVGRDGPLDTRHVIAAVLFDPQDHAKQLEQWGFRLGTCRKRFLQHMHETFPSEAEKWGEILPRPEQKVAKEREYKMSELIEVAIKHGRKSFTGLGEQGSECLLRSDGLAIALAEVGMQQPKEDRNAGAFLYQELVHRAGKGDSSLISRLREWWAGQTVSPELATSDFHATLERAEKISRQVGNDGRICGRHLLAALLTGSTEGWFSKMAGETGLNLRESARRFLQVMNDSGPLDPKMEQWEKFLGTEPSAAETRTEAVLRMAGVATEMLDGPDQLGVEKEAGAFANLICAHDLKPPLAIGVFGDWGSGKSFFMRKIRKAVGDITEEARALRETTEALPFYSDVIQIEFNAWHYVDTSLWASMVTHIFEELDRVFSTKEEKEINRWGELVKQLHSHAQLKAAAEAELKEAETEKTNAANVLAQREQELTRLTTRGIIDALLQSEKSEEIRQAIAQVEKAVGGKEIRDVAGQWREMLAEVNSFEGQARLFKTTLTQGKGAIRNMALIGAGLIVVMLVIPVVLPKLKFITDEFQRNAMVLAAEVSAALTALGAWLMPALKKSGDVMRALVNINNAATEKAKEPKFAQELKAAQDRVERARTELTQQAKQVEDLRSELQMLRPTQRLATFLKDRAESGDYRKYLGLLALIRKDFDRLGHLMNIQRKERREPACVLGSFDTQKDTQGSLQLSAATFEALRRELEACTPPHVLDGKYGLTEERGVCRLTNPNGTADLRIVRKETGKFEVFTDSKLPAIDRIVLYIDDLDRCPPKKVVEVLQAIHLMLAFPLFVVVVGVDARWIRHSLKRIYPSLLQEMNGGESGTPAGNGQMASPRDYLEKIFHIPYWLRSMDGHGRDRLLNSLLEDTVSPAPKKIQREMVPVNAGTEGVEREEEIDLDNLGKEGAKNVDNPVEDPGALQARTTKEEKTQRLRKRAEKVRLEPEELDAIKALRVVVGDTPRSVKRYVNIYRLVRASKTGKELEKFLGRGQKEAEFHGFLIVLALVNSPSPYAQNLLKELMKLESNSRDVPFHFIEFIEQKQGAEADHPWDEFAEILRNYSVPRNLVLRLESIKELVPEVWRYSFNYRG